MPAITRDSTVLVTGASGFLAVWITKELIERGYKVRGTVRSATKGEYIKKLFGDNFTYAIVPEMESTTAYDEAVVGVDDILHTSSPVHFPEGDPDVIIKPAVAGVVNILESAKKFGSTVKRIVLTSSTTAAGDAREPIVLTENDWNEYAINAVKEQGAAANPVVKYSASKTLAEKAAWEYIEKNKGSLSYDLTTVVSPWIFGPMMHEGSDVSSFNVSTSYLLSGFDLKNPKTGEELIKKDGEYVDVRDVAIVHAELLEHEAAGGERYIPSATDFSWQSVYDAANEPPAAKDVPVGIPGSAKSWAFANSTKFTDLIGKKRSEFYRPLADTVKDTLESARARGWVAA